jgi:DNA topoisomerase-1
VQAKLGIEAAKLYELIWKRTLASQMKDSYGTTVNVQVRAGDALLRASGKTIEFAGYLRAYVEGSDDPEAELADRERLLPPLKEGETVLITAVEPQQHETQAPARYTEGSLIRELERRGIGRPSTWATIVDTVLSRAYAFKKGTALVPTFLAMAVIGLMEGSFKDLVDYDFTANLEDDLDTIARGESGTLQYLKKFWYGNGHAGLKRLVAQGEENIDPRIVCGIPLGFDEQQRKVEVRIGRYGPFVTNGQTRASLPETIAPDELTFAKAQEFLAAAERGPEPLGVDPNTGKAVFVKTGRFGPYVQLGEAQNGEEKPKMVSLLEGMKPQDVTLELALKLLALPKNLGTHPDTGQDVIVTVGRYGPYVICGEETRTLSSEDTSPLELTLERALAILREPKRRGRRTAAKPAKEIGVHPVSERKITLRSGRFGPYVTDGKINASVPKGADPDNVSLDDAVNLLEARAAKLASQEDADPEAPEAKGKRTSQKSMGGQTKTAVAKPGQ